MWLWVWVFGVSYPKMAVCEGVFQQSVTHRFCLPTQSGVSWNITAVTKFSCITAALRKAWDTETLSYWRWLSKIQISNPVLIVLNPLNHTNVTYGFNNSCLHLCKRRETNVFSALPHSVGQELSRSCRSWQRTGTQFHQLWWNHLEKKTQMHCCICAVVTRFKVSFQSHIQSHLHTITMIITIFNNFHTETKTNNDLPPLIIIAINSEPDFTLVHRQAS